MQTIRKFRSKFSALLLLIVIAILGASLFHAVAGTSGDLFSVVRSGTGQDTAPATTSFVANAPIMFGPSGTNAPVAAPFTCLSGTNLAGTLPAAPPLTYFYSLAASGTSSAVYIKLTGTGTAGWFSITGTFAAVQ